MRKAFHEARKVGMTTRLVFVCLLTSLCAQATSPYPGKTPDTAANRNLQRYWELRSAEVSASGSLDSIKAAADWTSQQDEARRQLREMLGLDPLPARTDLKPVITGELKGEGFRVEKLHFQSMPGLYVTANLYLPDRKIDKPLPTILYVCGHGGVKKDGVSFGNKTSYHHHGIWFAHHDYACLIIDTLQLGEIEGEHHGTYNLNKWWWMARGYTSAGVEAWNCMRALDYLETRPEVDAKRCGVTGRSGGGAYSWWIAALDERIAAAAPTAGITTMKNHVADGCVEGHCDCMFMVNTYRWDFDRVAALVAPRPLLIVNTDKDPIFPIDGVFHLYQSTRRLYDLLGKEGNIGLQVAEGPHKDLQPLNTGAFHWFERFLKGADPMATTDEAAKKSLQPEQLKVFAELPADQHNTKIDHEFVPLAKTSNAPPSQGEWSHQRDAWMQALKDKAFRAWPTNAGAVSTRLVETISNDGVTMSAYDFTSQEPFQLRLFIAHREGLKPEELDLIALHVLDEEGWQSFASEYSSRFAKLFDGTVSEKPDDAAFESEKKMLAAQKWAMGYIAPRGVGLTAWTGDAKPQTQRLRRFYLLGETKDSTQVWDIRRAVQAVRSLAGFDKTKLWLASGGTMGVNTLYASLFEDNIARLDLNAPSSSHMDGPVYLNVLRYLDIPQAAAMAAERTKVIIYAKEKRPWDYLTKTAEKLGWPKNVQLRDLPPEQ